MAPRTSARRSPDDTVAPRRIGRRRDVDRAADAEETRENILNVATREFAEKGLSGARIDEIAEQTNTSKRMIYYYFSSKEGLYRAVVGREYGRIRDAEAMTQYLMAVLQGISVQAGAGASREQLQQVADATLAVWPSR